MAQSWVDLLFAHWQIPTRELERVVPAPLLLDTYDGAAWLGVTPFEVRNLRLRPTPPLPVLSAFPEINVRTYVHFGGKPGIFFFSLDADSRLAVTAARRSYRLPYFRADMSIRRSAGRTHYQSRRSAQEWPAPSLEFQGTYQPVGPRCAPRPGTLEHWLTERYCLYTLDQAQRVLRGEIHHPPWQLAPAQADIELNTLPEEIGQSLSAEPLLHHAARQDVVFWALAPAQDGSPRGEDPAARATGPRRAAG
jgi:uncharacterized protein YqjF (DUF2071 family)